MLHRILSGAYGIGGLIAATWLTFLVLSIALDARRNLKGR